MLAATSPSSSNKSNPLLPFPKDIHPIFPEMEPFQSQTHKHKTKRHKKSLTQDQLRLLEISFNHDNKLEPARKAQLAHDLGLPPRQIAIWYQNKRARWKTQSLELDYRTLQLRLHSVFEEKRRLEGEVGILRTELQRAREMLLVMNLAAPPVSSLSTSYNENASPSFPEVQWEKTLQVDELYSCLMSPEEQTVGLQINHQ